LATRSRSQIEAAVADVRVTLDVEFDTVGEAEAFRASLRALWGSGRAAPALVGSPQARIVEEVQSETY
jgi:hypothetical protein